MKKIAYNLYRGLKILALFFLNKTILKMLLYIFKSVYRLKKRCMEKIVYNVMKLLIIWAFYTVFRKIM